MQRISAVNPAEATGKVKELLDGVQTKLGMTPNLMKTLAAGPAALEAYLKFGSALSTGKLDAKFREQIALAVAQANSCEYCLSAHTAFGQTLVVQRGTVSDQEVAKVKAAGFSDGDIAELVANVALNVFTNYFNHVARTDVDFPQVSVAMEAAAV